MSRYFDERECVRVGSDFLRRRGLGRARNILVLFLSVIVAGRAADVSLKIEDQKGRAVDEAVVWAPGIGKPEPSSATIFQKDRQFSPTVTVIPVGSLVRFPNRDTVQHHVYSFSSEKKFDLPLYSGKAPSPVKFDQSGVITLGCNIHDWMVAYIVVLDTTAFTRTGADGVAVLKGIQSGVALKVWHSRLRGKVVEVPALQGGKVVLPLRPVDLRTPDDFNSGY